MPALLRDAGMAPGDQESDDMARPRKWRFARVSKQSRDALCGNCRLSELNSYFNSSTANKLAVIIADRLHTTVGTARQFEFFYLLSIGDFEAAWRRLHITWRSDVFRHRVLFAWRDQVMLDKPKQAARGELPAQQISNFEVNDWLMAAAFSAVVGEDEVADWLGRECVNLWKEPPPGMKSDAFTLGPVEPWLLALYCKWRGIPLDLSENEAVTREPFGDILEHWDDPSTLEGDVLRLCEIHARKAANRELENNDFIFGLHWDFPTEIFFLQRIRRDLGLSVPDPDHPLLRSPMSQLPFPCPKSGYDSCLADAYKRCKEQLPNLSIPWEDEYQKLGPSDSKALPLTDLPIP